MTRDKEELMSYEMHEREWYFDTSKTEEAAFLDLIAMLRVKSTKTDQVKLEVHVDNKDT